jgi:hypothetical protein
MLGLKGEAGESPALSRNCNPADGKQDVVNRHQPGKSGDPPRPRSADLRGKGEEPWLEDRDHSPCRIGKGISILASYPDRRGRGFLFQTKGANLVVSPQEDGIIRAGPLPSAANVGNGQPRDLPIPSGIGLSTSPVLLYHIKAITQNIRCPGVGLCLHTFEQQGEERNE